MQVNSVNSTNFTSRNPQIRTLENIMRKSNNAYPAASVSSKALYDTVKQKPVLLNKLSRSAQKLIFLVRMAINEVRETSTKDYFQKVLEVFNKYKLANCMEQTDLSATVLRMNGISSQRAEMFVKDCIPDGEVYKHVLTVIPLKKDAITSQDFQKTPLQKLKDILIYDSFCGFVDFPAKASERYKGEYQRYVKSQMAKMLEKDSYFTERINKDIYLNFDIPQAPEMEDAVRNNLRTQHPELLLK